MKRIIAVLSVVIILIAGLFFYFNWQDKIDIEKVDAISLRTADGTVEVERADFTPYINLYNGAKWTAQTDDLQVGSAGLTVDVFIDDGTHKLFSIVPDDKAALHLVGEQGIAHLDDDIIARDVLFDARVLTGREQPFAAPALAISGACQGDIAASSSAWQYQNIYGQTAEQCDSYRNDITPSDFVIDQPEATLQFKLADGYDVDDIVVTANQTALAVTALGDQTYQVTILPKLGQFNYQITVKTKAVQRGVYSATAEFVYDFPVIHQFAARAALLQTEQTAGGFFLIKGDYFDENTQLVVEQSIIDEPIKCYTVDDAVFAVIPLDYYAAVGQHEVVLYAEKDGARVELARQQLTVLERDYAMQNLTISSKTDKETRSDEAYREYREDFMPIRQSSVPQQLWQGQFIMPIEGRLTTDYGAKRKVNNALTRYRHNGLDLAAPTGTEIMASNSGKVVFSRQLIMTGNTIIIDHGLGFFTYYLHMDERRAELGDMVEKGQIIGTVGTTGFSTGAHLHFTASYHLKSINPYLLIDWTGEWQ